MESPMDVDEVPPTPPVDKNVKASTKPDEIKIKDNKEDEAIEVDQKVNTPKQESDNNSLDDFVNKSSRKKVQNKNDDDIMVELAQSRIVKRSLITDEDIRVLIVKCTSCGHQINHHDKRSIKVHPYLHVIICKECNNFYGNGNFSEDDEGDKYCRWCAQGGTVLGCDHCRNVFCCECIRRNFGRGEVRRVRDSEWKCYVCDPSQLKEKMAYCEMVGEYSNRIRVKAKRKEMPKNVEDLDEQMSTILDSSIALTDRFKKKVDKLKKRCTTSSRKQILKRLEHVMAEHRSEMKWLMGNVRQSYKKYSMTLVQNLNGVSQVDQNDVIICDVVQNKKSVMVNPILNDPSVAKPLESKEKSVAAPSAQSTECSSDKLDETVNTETMEEEMENENTGVEELVNGHESDKEVVLNPTTRKYGRKPNLCKVTEETDNSDEIKLVKKSTETSEVSDSDHGLAEKCETLKKKKSSTQAKNSDSKKKSSLVFETKSVRKNETIATESEHFPPATLKATLSSNESQNFNEKVEQATSKAASSLEENQLIDKNEKPRPKTQKSQSFVPEKQNIATKNLENELADDESKSHVKEHSTNESPNFPPVTLKKQEGCHSDNSVDTKSGETEDMGALSDVSTAPNDSEAENDSQPRKKRKKLKRTPKKERPLKPKHKGDDSPTKLKSSNVSDWSDLETSSFDSDESFTNKKNPVPRARMPEKKKKVLKKQGTKQRDVVISNKELFVDDWKIFARITVPIQRLEIDPQILKETLELYPEGSNDTSETKDEEDEMSEFDYLEKQAECLLKHSDERPKPRKVTDKGGSQQKKSKRKVDKKKPASKKTSSSDMASLSSSDDEKFEKIVGSLRKVISPDKALNVNSKNKLLNNFDDTTSMDTSSEGESSETIKKKKVMTKTAPKNKNSSESDISKGEETDTEDHDDSSGVEFIKKKKKKKEKLLKTSIKLSDEDFKSDSIDGIRNKNDEKKRKSVKRKVIYSDDDLEGRKSGNSTCTTESDSSSEREKRKKKTKKGRKRVKISDSSEEQSEKKEEKEKDKQDTPGKGRKNIRKVISHRKLAEETKAAQDEEKERRKRIAEKQKMYNQIIENAEDEHNKITKKFVLEVDPESKEEIVEIHPDIIEKLKPHQVNGVKFMWESTIESIKRLESGPGSGCILAHCMGLGKTLQVIAFLYTLFCNRRINKKIRTAMIICPYNTVLNWINEFNVWLAGCDHSLNLYDITPVKTNRTRMEFLAEWQECGGVLVLGYNMFSRLAEGKLNKASSKLKQRVIELITDPGPDIVVCDEGHMLKNETSALSKAASKLKTRRRVVLTGTPLQNNLKEYHCMMQFVKPNLLGTSKEFHNRFVNPIINGQYDNSSKLDVQVMKKRVHILHKLLEGCVQRCDYSALTKFLPLKLEFVISVKLSEVQIKLYRKYFELFLQDKDKPSNTGGRLFIDYNNLKNIWTFPHMLFMAHERAEQKRKFDDEDDFIDSNEYDTDDSFINDASDDDDEAGPSKKNDDSSEEEVIQKRTSRRRNGEVETVEEEPVKNKQWWEEIITEEDKFKVEFSGKMVLALEILKECETIGDKVLIFSQSLQALDVLQMLLHNQEEIQQKESESEEPKTNKSQECVYGTWTEGLDYFRMDGSTNVETRKHWIELFNDLENPRARLFLISTRAGSLGTNLVGANRVIMLDASWNPSHDVQAIFRVFRFGQVKPVYIYRLLAQGTMEEKIYNRQVTKLSLSCRVVDEQQIDRHFSAAQLAELYTFEPDSQTDRPTPMVPKDRLLADLLINHNDWIVTYHEHDSLLQSSTEVDLTEEERQAAWTEYENEKEGIFNNIPQATFVAGDNMGATSLFFVPDIDDAVKLLVRNVRKMNPHISTIDLAKSVVAQLDQLKKNLQSRHVTVLRQKQEFVSKSIQFPVQMQSLLTNLERALERISRYVEQFKKDIEKCESTKNMGPSSGTSANQQQYYIHMGARPQMYQRFNNPRNFPNMYATYRQAFAPGMRYMYPGNATNANFIHRPNVPKPTQSTVIVDVTDETETVSSNTVPIVVEAEENAEEEKEEQPSSSTTAPPQSSSSSSSVKITEIS